ncbi:MAG: hypothetical protein KGH62_04020, partial [Candidatus Micrarchaeota archaeon]|nr:hypothetical protein [Candidatus Micrarchaeota archaeon]
GSFAKANALSERTVAIKEVVNATTARELHRLARSDDLSCLELVAAHPKATTYVVETAARRALSRTDDTARMMYVLEEAVRSCKTGEEVNADIKRTLREVLRDSSASSLAKMVANLILDEFKSRSGHL